MNITVMSRRDLADTLRNEPHQHDVIIIHELDNTSVRWAGRLQEYCRKAICLGFEDVIGADPCGPTQKHVQTALDWAKTLDGDLIVSCQAGISRSSAIAYLVGCLHGTPEEAAKVFKNHHYPNELIIAHGITIFGEQIAPPVTDFYQRRALHYRTF
jgi:predicted protein tyrosine phosphatase